MKKNLRTISTSSCDQKDTSGSYEPTEAQLKTILLKTGFLKSSLLPDWCPKDLFPNFVKSNKGSTVFFYNTKLKEVYEFTTFPAPVTIPDSLKPKFKIIYSELKKELVNVLINEKVMPMGWILKKIKRLVKPLLDKVLKYDVQIFLTKDEWFGTTW